MANINDPLQKDAEQLFDKVYRELLARHPGRESDIDALIMLHEAEATGEGRRRGVKGSVGRPPTDKSVLAGWIGCLIELVMRHKIERGLKDPPPPGPEWIDMIPSERWAFNRVANLGLSYSLKEGANPTKYSLASWSTLKRLYAFRLSQELNLDVFLSEYYLAARHLSIALDSPALWEVHWAEIRGDDPQAVSDGMKLLKSHFQKEVPNPRQSGFTIDTTVLSSDQTLGKWGTATTPMHLHFPPVSNSDWESLREGLRLFGLKEIEFQGHGFLQLGAEYLRKKLS